MTKTITVSAEVYDNFMENLEKQSDLHIEDPAFDSFIEEFENIRKAEKKILSESRKNPIISLKF